MYTVQMHFEEYWGFESVKEVENGSRHTHLLSKISVFLLEFLHDSYASEWLLQSSLLSAEKEGWRKP